MRGASFRVLLALVGASATLGSFGAPAARANIAEYGCDIEIIDTFTVPAAGGEGQQYTLRGLAACSRGTQSPLVDMSLQLELRMNQAGCQEEIVLAGDITYTPRGGGASFTSFGTFRLQKPTSGFADLNPATSRGTGMFFVSYTQEAVVIWDSLRTRYADPARCVPDGNGFAVKIAGGTWQQTAVAGTDVPAPGSLLPDRGGVLPSAGNPYEDDPDCANLTADPGRFILLGNSAAGRDARDGFAFLDASNEIVWVRPDPRAVASQRGARSASYDDVQLAPVTGGFRLEIPRAALKRGLRYKVRLPDGYRFRQRSRGHVVVLNRRGRPVADFRAVALPTPGRARAAQATGPTKIDTPLATVDIHFENSYFTVEENTDFERTPVAGVVGTARGVEADDLSYCSALLPRPLGPTARAASAPAPDTPSPPAARAAQAGGVYCDENIGYPLLQQPAFFVKAVADTTNRVVPSFDPAVRCSGRLSSYLLRVRLERKSCKVGLFCNWPLMKEGRAVSHHPGVIIASAPRAACRAGKHRYRIKQRTQVTSATGRKLIPGWAINPDKPEYECP